MSDPHSPLRLNVGFIVHQSAGYSRDFPFSVPAISLPPDLHLDNLSGTCRATRTPQGILIQVEMQAAIPLECVRCLINFPCPLKINFTELYAFTRRNITDSGLIMPETGYIDLEPLVREYMLLEVPIKPLCRQDCKGLCPVCGENLNETTCHHEEEDINPLLAQLKNLLE